MTYHPPKNYSKKSKKTLGPGVKYPLALVWATAAAAHRINNNQYIKTAVWNYEVDPATIVTRPNREVMQELLDAPHLITKEDYAEGDRCLQWIRGDLTIRALTNRLTEFDLATQRVIAVEEEFDSNFDRLSLAIMPCLPASYRRGLVREEASSKMRMTTGEFIGKIDERLISDVEVLTTVYSHKWNVWYITAIDSENRGVFFSYQTQLSGGKKIQVKGTVKAHRDDGVTQLRHAKVLAQVND
jgi:hypothetical protein